MRPPVPRWLQATLITLVPMMAVGKFFAYHAPAAIGPSLQSYFSLTPESLGWLFTLYSVPNVLLVFLGGLLMDKYGLIRTSLGFNCCILGGMILCAVTPRYTSATPTMGWLLAGRFLLGLGGECLSASGRAILARWFKRSRWMTFALGVNQAAVQLFGSAAAFLLLPLVLGPVDLEPSSSSSSADIQSGRVRLCLWVTVIVGVLSLLANLLYASLEVRYGAVYVASAEQEEFESMAGDMLELAELAPPPPPSSSSQKHSHLAQKIASAHLPRKPRNLPSGSKSEGQYHIVRSADIEEVEVAPAHEHDLVLDEEEEDSPSAAHASNGHKEGQGRQGEAPAAHSRSDSLDSSSAASSPIHSSGSGSGERTGLLGGLSHLWSHEDGGSRSAASLWKPWEPLRQLPGLFWSVLLMHCLLSPLLFSFSAFGPQFFSAQYGLSTEEAGFATSLLYLSILLAPLFGALVDRFGYRALCQCAAGALLPTCFALLWFTSLHPYLLTVGLGVGFAATESNGLAMLAEVSPTSLLGTAYGLLGCGLSFFLLFQPWLVGYLHAHSSQAHAHILLLFLLLSSLGWLVSLCIFVWDVRHDSLLSLSSSQKQLGGAGGGADSMDGVDGHHAAPAPYPELEIVFEVEEEDEEDEEGMGLGGQEWAGSLQLEEEEGEEELHFQHLHLEAGGGRT